MNLVNATNMEAGYTMGVRPNGRELLVVVVKGTFTLPTNGEPPRLAEKQEPLVETDVFTGEPGFSAPLYEIDFAPTKPKCDVLFNGSAYAPNGEPAERVTVGIRVGSWKKSFDVIGNRTWTQGLLSMKASAAELFTTMPISYNNAFGGIDKGEEESEKDHYFLDNHVGVGYHVRKSAERMKGKPLPNTEETGNPITKPNGTYRPMAFGPLGRAWKQRVKYAGTYDQQWLDDQFPFLPKDFRDEYFQAAPADQWIDYPRGGEEIELLNVTPEGRTAFKLPSMDIPVEFHLRDGEETDGKTVLDTIVLETDQKRFMLTWRANLPLRRNIHEMQKVLAGNTPAREAQLRRGKPRFSSLAELARWNRETFS